jgi:hypothetical protein
MAIHEAGHAVIGRVLTLVCGHATIVVDHEAGELGHSITADPRHAYTLGRSAARCAVRTTQFGMPG